MLGSVESILTQSVGTESSLLGQGGIDQSVLLLVLHRHWAELLVRKENGWSEFGKVVETVGGDFVATMLGAGGMSGTSSVSGTDRLVVVVV